jgi:hypothetical protein
VPPPFSPVFNFFDFFFSRSFRFRGLETSGDHLSMIIRDLNIFGSSVRPSEADPILIIDPNRVLAFSVPLQCFQLVVGRRPQIGQFGRPFQLFQFPPCNLPDVMRTGFARGLAVRSSATVSSRAQSRPQRANFGSVFGTVADLGSK